MKNVLIRLFAIPIIILIIIIIRITPDNRNIKDTRSTMQIDTNRMDAMQCAAITGDITRVGFSIIDDYLVDLTCIDKRGYNLYGTMEADSVSIIINNADTLILQFRKAKYTQRELDSIEIHNKRAEFESNYKN